MCGIISYIGDKPALPRLIEGLRRLEYRGYDSAGLALFDPAGSAAESLWVRKAVGRVDELAGDVDDSPPATVGIAHTRWATHGGITQPNAHPHLDADLRIAVVHNGIIENMNELKAMLVAEGVKFRSETDTEILPHLIRRAYTGDPLQAVCNALALVRGTWGIAVLFADHPDRIIAARNGSPLVIGLGDGETILGSDPQAIVAHTRRVIYLDDREIAVLTRDGAQVTKLDGRAVSKDHKRLEGEWGVADKAGFPHFMLKEIHEQSEAIRRCLSGRVMVDPGNAKLGGLNMGPRELVNVGRVINIGCGTSYHAGMVGAMAIEAMARVSARAEIASEFRARNPIIHPDALYFAVSQSGETADTLGAIEEVQLHGGQCMGVVNVVGSTIARTCGQGVYLHCGPEIAVASTKAFTSQVAALMTFTLMIARTRNLSHEGGKNVAKALLDVPNKVQQYLAEPGPIDEVVAAVAKARYVLYLGRGFSYPVALEGALKLKEVAYVPCEGYPAGEMKHGPIAMLEKGTPVVCLAPADSHRDKVISNMKEVQARGARLIIIHERGDSEIAAMADISIPIPAVPYYLTPFLTVLPLQLIAYRAALANGRDIDKPRNLAKSVTVE
jgi:glucosamine--fructose-6-phosphate aminotransferase (isomerizing)